MDRGYDLVEAVAFQDVGQLLAAIYVYPEFYSFEDLQRISEHTLYPVYFRLLARNVEILRYGGIFCSRHARDKDVAMVCESDAS